MRRAQSVVCSYTQHKHTVCPAAMHINTQPDGKKIERECDFVPHPTQTCQLFMSRK